MARKSLIDIEIRGLNELSAAFEALPKSVAKRTMTTILKKAAVPIAEEAFRLAPRDQDAGGPHLADSITVSTKLTARQRRYRQKRGSEAEVFVGPRAPHAHLVEFGTAERVASETHVVKIKDRFVTIAKGQSLGRVTPKPYLRPAWDRRKDEARRLAAQLTWVELARAARRLRRKSERLLKKLGG